MSPSFIISGKSNHSNMLFNIAKILNIIVLICSLIIFIILSIEILKGPNSIPHRLYMNIQLTICLLFLFDFFYLLYLSDQKWRYFLRNCIFLFISIPYTNIIYWLHLDITPILNIVFHSMLLIRGGYGLVIMITWFTSSKATNLLLSYIVILIGTAYFGSLAFYAIEKDVNSSLHNFGDAAWWACMDVTTVGCAIEPVTSQGRVLAVILAVMGMSVFPILTAYITTKFQEKVHKKQDPIPSISNNEVNE